MLSEFPALVFPERLGDGVLVDHQLDPLGWAGPARLGVDYHDVVALPGYEVRLAGQGCGISLECSRHSRKEVSAVGQPFSPNTSLRVACIDGRPSRATESSWAIASGV